MLPANKKSSQLNDVNYVGSSCGAMSVSPADAAPDEMQAGDLETAMLFGKRVAEITARWLAAKQ